MSQPPATPAAEAPPGTKTEPRPTPIRVAVAGAGVFGLNHLRVYRELEQAGHPVQLAAVIDPADSARAAAEARFAIPAFASIEEVLAATRSGQIPPIDAASIAVPTVHHAAAAETLMAAGIDVLIEKPLASSLAEAGRILAAQKRFNRIAQPGHLERYNPAVTAARSLIHCPMFFEVHRLSVFTPRSLDVDVVLDLMIHDLDIVLSLVRAGAGNAVREVRAVGLPVLSPRVDIANVRLEFASGCIANLTASRVSTERVRKMRFFQPHQYLSLDFARQDLLLIDVTAAAGMSPAQLAGLMSPADPAKSAAGPHPSAGLSLRKLPTEPGEPLRLEILDFLHSVQTRHQPSVTAEDGRAALALALEINSEIASHARRTGLT